MQQTVCERDDFLLHVLSHYRSISWSRFKTIFGELYSPVSGRLSGGEQWTFGWERSKILRSLAWLGHVDVDFSQAAGEVRVLPPTLQQLPVAGLPFALFCGSRGPTTVKRLMELSASTGVIVGVDAQPSRLPLVSRRVTAVAGAHSELSHLAESLGVEFIAQPSFGLVAPRSLSLDEYLVSLAWESGGALNWERRAFDPVSLRFGHADTNREKLRLHRYEDPRRGIRRFYLIRHVRDVTGGAVFERAEIDPDWGRYAILADHTAELLLYDPVRLVFGVPERAPLPIPLARLLVMCSGYLPVTAKDPHASGNGGDESSGPYSWFRWIPQGVAEIVAQKLDQRLSIVERPEHTLQACGFEPCALNLFTPD